MNPFAALSHPAARSLLLAQAGAISLVAGAAAAPALVDHSALGGVGLFGGWLARCAWPAAGAALAMGLCVWMVTRQLRAPLFWERTLALVDRQTAEPILLPTCSGGSAAERGWNRLAALGRRWQTFAELEQRVTSQLAGTTDDTAATVLEALADGVVGLDPAGRIVSANAAFVAICGADSVDEVLGQSLPEALGATGDEARTLSSGAKQATLAFDCRRPSATGPEGVLRCARRPRSGASGASLGCVWSIRDVTQQRLAEAMRDQFLAAATHELRTPLANIRAYAESLEMGGDADSESRKRFYNVIQAEAERVSRLIDDLLDISRMQAGALALDRHETDLGRLVDEVAAKVRPLMAEKKLTFHCEFPPKFPKAAVDKNKLVAALVNLLGNAAKYTPTGGRVKFRVEINEHQVEFSVADTGIGIAADELPRVFERFFRGDDERVRAVTGSGLGLALTQEVARLHQGDVTVESVLNKGSTFRLTLPFDSLVSG